jgi:8-oxo-dGTP pyrophosphatase MutT (NUDIX family)
MADAKRLVAVMAQAITTGRVLMTKRADTGHWSWPAGYVEGGESDEQAAYREFFEETGYRLGSVGQAILRRDKDDGAGPIFCTRFLTVVREEVVPVLNSEATSWGWFDEAMCSRRRATAWSPAT